MSKQVKAIIAISIIILVCLIVWAVRSVPQPPDTDSVQVNTVMKYDGNTIREEKNGKVIWELTADDISVDKDTQNAEMTNIKAKYYSEDGKEVGITAPHGRYENGSRNIKLDGGVKGETNDGAKLTSKELIWNAKASKLIAKGDAKIERESEHMKARGNTIESSNSFQRFKVKGKAHIEKGN